MNLWEYLDRVGERASRRAPRPVRDIRQFIGFAFLAGYYVMVWRFATGEVPKGNLDLIRDAMLTLGPPVGLIVGAMFRTDAREEQATVNTGKFADAIKEQARASGTLPDVTLQPGQTAQAAPDATDAGANDRPNG